LATFGRFMQKFWFLYIAFFLLSGSAFGQSGTVQGFVRDGSLSIPSANIKLIGYAGGTSTDGDGYFTMKVPADTLVTLRFTFVGFETVLKDVNVGAGGIYLLNVNMEMTGIVGNTFTISTTRVEGTTMKALEVAAIEWVPGPNDDLINSILSTEVGVAINNELSSSYSVRGGSFDENLIYVNDIEIYRPFLVRAGQQEGLSFPNADMVESIVFSAGGFGAKYGDKMSSVLDITYKKPDKFAASTRMSLLGGAAHVEGTSENYRFTHVSGIRYKSNQYVLNSLETQGDYKPNFFDFQTFMTYDVSDNVELNLLGHVSRNKYQFIPETRETEFGTINEALKLTVYFEGQEVDQFQTMTGAVSVNVKSDDRKFLFKFIGSAFNSDETETFDILGEYWLDELERDLGSEEFGEVAFNRGIGGFLNHARNRLQANVINVAHKGFHYGEKSNLLWGVKAQSETIHDELSEWNMIDSSGYSIPQGSLDVISLQDVVKTEIDLQSIRYTGFVQNVWKWEKEDNSQWILIAGARANYWTYSEQVVASPRATLSWQPNWQDSVQYKDTDSLVIADRDWEFRFATGLYHQPPFYRELRDFSGVLNPEIRAQRAIHFVLGADYLFKAWDRPFKLITELYYKHLTDLIPYEVDNVRVRYYATNNSKGYAAGIDMKLNGEFIPGIQSWASLSIMQTQEDILDDFYYVDLNAAGDTIIYGFTQDDVVTDSILNEPGYIPRNQDQRVNFGMFFQDQMPRWPSYKVHLNLVFGSGLPFGPPTHERYKDVLRTPPYRRVDIGFSKTLIDKETEWKNEKTKLRFVKDAWVSLEIFNMFGINNTSSYLWVKDVSNRQYAIPNFLTSRRLNLKFVMKF
jgi:hypothetical protein